jgi:nucleoside recognition membrane protein YjiH
MQKAHIFQALADLVLLVHFAIVIFIVLGLVLIVIGGIKNWQWIRNPLFRYLHLTAIGVVVLQAWLGKLCPLTLLENSLREKAGEATYPGSFIGYWIQQLLYYELPLWVFAMLYTVFGLIVVICWFMFKPTSSKETQN